MITKPKLEQFRDELDEFSKAMQEKFGIAISIGNIRYSSDQATGKINIVSTENTGDAQEAQDIIDFKKAMYKHGLSLEDRLKIFMFGGKKYKLMSLRPRAPKWPFIVEEISTGKRLVLRKGFGVIEAIKEGKK